MVGQNFRKWRHDDLLHDLADNQGNTIYRETPLGSVWAGQYGGKGNGTQIADVIRIRPSYTQFCVDIYEVKVSRADFLSDIRSGKWRGYLPCCHRFYFAVPSGLVKKTEIPEGCGLIIRGDRGWSTIVGAKPQDLDVPYDMLLSMLFLRPRLRQRRKRLNDIKSHNSNWAKQMIEDRVAKKLGVEIGQALAYIRKRSQGDVR